METVITVKITDGVPSIDATLSSPGLTLEVMEQSVGFLQRMIMSNVVRNSLRAEAAAAMTEAQASQSGLVIPSRGLR